MPTDEQQSPDNVVSLLPWDIAIKGAVQRRDAHALLAREDADQAIRGLSELELYYAVKALGADEAGPLLALVTREQIRALVDLDVWQKDRLAIEDLLVWLSAFKEVSEARLADAVLALDPETVGTLLRRRLLITRVLRDDDGGTLPSWAIEPPEELLPVNQSPDRRFLYAARTVDEWDEIDGAERRIDEEERKAVLDLVEVLYQVAGPEQASAVLRLAETDMSSDLEETAFRFREARLEDLGFPSLARAIEVYTPVAPAELGQLPVQPAPELHLPALHAGRVSQGLLRDALRAIPSAEAVRRIEAELVPLANAMLRADGVEPQDLEGIKGAIDRMRAYLELGIAHGVAPGQMLEVAAERLVSNPLRVIFGVGYGLTLRLHTMAKRILGEGAFRAGERSFALLVDEDRSLLAALLERRPRLVLGPSAEPRPFASLSDLQRVEAELNRIQAAGKLSVALSLREASAGLSGALEPPLFEERPVRMLLATVAARALLGSPPRLEPFSAADLAALVPLLEGRRFPPAKVLAAAAAVAGPHPGAPQEIAAGLDEVAEGLAGLPPGAAIDPRFVGGLVRRVG